MVGGLEHFFTFFYNVWIICIYIYILVGGLEHEFYIFLLFHILKIIIPTDFHIFQRVSNHQPDSKPQISEWLVPTIYGDLGMVYYGYIHITLLR